MSPASLEAGTVVHLELDLAADDSLVQSHLGYLLDGDQLSERVFWETVTRAEAAAKVRLSGLISSLAQEDWRAAAWMLE